VEGRIQLDQSTCRAKRKRVTGSTGKGSIKKRNLEECYNGIPKSTLTRELKEQCLKQWQNEWETTPKRETTKSFFRNIEDSLKLRINPTPKFTSIVTCHINIKLYLHKLNIIVNPKCSCNEGEQTVDHIIYSCSL
jgi:hypothetical protein